MDRGAWWARVHGITKNQTRLKELSTAHSEENLGKVEDYKCQSAPQTIRLTL